MTGVVVGLDFERTKVVDFSTYLFMDTEKITFKRPVLESDMAGFVKPYTPAVSIFEYGYYNLRIRNNRR